jgi:hypothetical protein
MMSRNVLEHFAILWHVKLRNLCPSLNALFRGTKVVKHPFYSIGPKMVFRSVSKHFADLWHVKICKTCVRAYVHYLRPKLRNMHPTPLDEKWCLGVFRSILLTFRHIKRCEICVSGLNVLFQCNEVMKHQFYSIGTKMMFGSVSQCFANIWHVKVAYLCSSLNALFRNQSCEASILLHLAQIDVWECFGVFH